MVGLVASMTILWAIFIPHGSPWMGLVLVSLAVFGALWVRMRSPRSVSQVIDDIEAEPVPVAARVPKAVL
jgi:hypothetical protein